MKIKLGLIELEEEKVYFPFTPRNLEELKDSKFIEKSTDELEGEIALKWSQLKELLEYFQDLYANAQLPSKDMDMTENYLYMESSDFKMLSKEAKEVLLEQNPRYQEKSDFVILTDAIDLLRKFIREV